MNIITFSFQTLLMNSEFIFHILVCSTGWLLVEILMRAKGEHRSFRTWIIYCVFFLECHKIQYIFMLICSQVEMSPLENAIEVLENKNQQLKTLISQCQTRQMQNINPLTMCLNGVIDAAVNGGVSRYQEVRIRY